MIVHILVTRPRLQADKTAGSLIKLGHKVCREPLLKIETIQSQLPEVNIDGIILTSSNALPALDKTLTLEQRREVPVLVTGDATARAARDLGFTNTQHVAGSALDLVGKAREWMAQNNLDPTAHLLYPSAETLAHDIDELLSKIAILSHRWIVYRSVPSSRLSASTLNAFHNGEIDAVLLYSKRTAHTFVQLMRHHELSMSGLRAFVLSPEILESLPEELRNHAQCADQPNENALLSLIGPELT